MGSNQCCENEYQKMPDEEVVELSQKGETKAMDYLLNKYSSLVKKEVRALYLIGADTEDLIQEGMIGLFKAIRDYKKENDTGFYSFARLCVLRQMYTAVTASSRKKHAPLNSYISFYTPIAGEDQKTALIMDVLKADEENSNPEDMILGQEKLQQMQKKIEDKLSPMEHQVLELYLNGIGYVEIAEKMKKPAKAIDNAIQRIRRKLQKCE